MLSFNRIFFDFLSNRLRKEPFTKGEICSCCGGYLTFLNNKGIEVEITQSDENLLEYEIEFETDEYWMETIKLNSEHTMLVKHNNDRSWHYDADN